MTTLNATDRKAIKFRMNFLEGKGNKAPYKQELIALTKLIRIAKENYSWGAEEVDVI